MGEGLRAPKAPEKFFADHAHIGAFLLHFNIYTVSLLKYNGPLK